MFIYLILAVLGLRRCMGFSVGAASAGSSLAALGGLLTVVASRCRARASGCTSFSSRNTPAQLPRSVWDLRRPGT